MIIPICFAVNDYYVPYMAAMMQSIMENAGMDRQYKFYVLHRDITAHSIALLREQISMFPQFTIDFIDVTEHIEGYDLFVSRHLTVETYFRLLIPYMFQEYDRVLYFDGDMICLIDVAELFDIDLRENMIAAVRDIAVSRYYSPNHGKEYETLYAVLSRLKSPSDYFNAGMLVWDIAQFRKMISIAELFKLAVSRQWQVHDQDILNYLCEGRTFHLPYKWDFMRDDPGYKYLPPALNKEYLDAEQSPKIIHYKPYQEELYRTHFQYFWKYATRTPFVNVIIERMKDGEYISNVSFYKKFIYNIKCRKSPGLRTILTDCLQAWLARTKAS